MCIRDSRIQAEGQAKKAANKQRKRGSNMSLAEAQRTWRVDARNVTLFFDGHLMHKFAGKMWQMVGKADGVPKDSFRHIFGALANASDHALHREHRRIRAHRLTHFETVVVGGSGGRGRPRSGERSPPPRGVAVCSARRRSSDSISASRIRSSAKPAAVNSRTSCSSGTTGIIPISVAFSRVLMHASSGLWSRMRTRPSGRCAR